MAENETVEDETKDSGPIKQLRAAEKAAKAEAAEYRALLMKGAYADLKLDTDAGLGKAIAKEYDGAPTVEALAEYAKGEYGYEKPAGETNPQAEQIVAGQAQLDAAATGAGSVTPPTEQDTLAKAEAEGDFDTAMNIKAGTIAGWFAGGPQ